MIARRFCLALACAALTTPAARAEDFYKGKTITILVGFSPGGGFDINARLLARHLGRFIPGRPEVVVTNMPGASSLTAVQYLDTRAPKDGTVIDTFNFGLISDSKLFPERVKADFRGYGWIGSISVDVTVCYTWGALGLKTLDDLRKREVLVGSSGRSSETYINPAVMNVHLGTKFKIVTGYSGVAAVNLAAERGESEASFTTWNDVWNNHADWLRDKKITVMFQIALAKKVADVPLLVDVADDEMARAVIEFMSSSSQMGQSWVGPPGMAPDILAALREAFDATMRDPDYVEAMRKGNLEINPMGGADLAAVVAKTIGSPRAVVDAYQAAVAGQ